MDGNWVGASRAQSYISFSADPGEHHFCVDGKFFSGSKGKQISLTSLDVESGKTYFLQARLHFWQPIGNFYTAFDLELLNLDQGKYLLEILPYSTSHPKK
jgi:hypothetical protein